MEWKSLRGLESWEESHVHHPAPFCGLVDEGGSFGVLRPSSLIASLRGREESVWGGDGGVEGGGEVARGKGRRGNGREATIRKLNDVMIGKSRRSAYYLSLSMDQGGFNMEVIKRRRRKRRKRGKS